MDDCNKSDRTESLKHNAKHLLVTIAVACILVMLHIAGAFEKFDHFFLINFQSDYELEEGPLNRESLKNNLITHLAQPVLKAYKAWAASLLLPLPAGAASCVG